MLRKVATVLTVYGIETTFSMDNTIFHAIVATVLTVYGIETQQPLLVNWPKSNQLQQSLPFTVLKHEEVRQHEAPETLLQQSLPFTVLKRVNCLNTTKC